VREFLVLEEQRAAKKAKGKKRPREDDLDFSDTPDGPRDGDFLPEKNSRRSEGIVNLVVSEFNLVNWKDDRRWYAVVVILAKDHVQPDLPNLEQTTLLDLDGPSCCIYEINNG
jgi:hypothetical protein